MTKDRNKMLKNYFESEISSRLIPPRPEIFSNRRSRADNFFLACCTAAGLVILFLPGIQSEVLQSLTVSKEIFETGKNNFNLVLFDAAQEYKKNKGVFYD